MRKGIWQRSVILESAGGASCIQASCPPRLRCCVNRQGMLWGNCLGVKPNTQHIWQTVYSLCCISSTKHGACPFFVQTDTFHNQVPDISVNYVGRHAGTHAGSTHWWIVRSTQPTHMHISLAVAGSNYTSHIYKSLLLVWRQVMGDRWILDK